MYGAAMVTFLCLFCSSLSLVNSCHFCRLVLYCIEFAAVLTFDGLLIDMPMSLCIHDNLMESMWKSSSYDSGFWSSSVGKRLFVIRSSFLAIFTTMIPS